VGSRAGGTRRDRLLRGSRIRGEGGGWRGRVLRGAVGHLGVHSWENGQGGVGGAMGLRVAGAEGMRGLGVLSGEGGEKA